MANEYYYPANGELPDDCAFCDQPIEGYIKNMGQQIGFCDEHKHQAEEVINDRIVDACVDDYSLPR